MGESTPYLIKCSRIRYLPANAIIQTLRNEGGPRSLTALTTSIRENASSNGQNTNFSKPLIATVFDALIGSGELSVIFLDKKVGNMQTIYLAASVSNRTPTTLSSFKMAMEYSPR